MPDGIPATTRRVLVTAVPAALLLSGLAAPAAWAAASKAELNRDGQAALQQLYSVAPKAREMGAKARAILVFPRIVKAGLMVGGLTGNGVLLEGGRPTQYFNLSAATYGLQIGAQKYAYALFFINQSAIDYLKKSDGWAIGSGPSVVVMDEGKALSTTSTTVTQDVYAFPFGQKGLMAGLGLEGSKITQIHPS
jgi:lipid-binding SYLF domain-containing protein